MEFLLQRCARLGDLEEELFVFGQKVVHVAKAGIGVVRVLEVDVETARLNLGDGDTPSAFVFHTGGEAVGLGAPPGFEWIKFFDANGFAFVVAWPRRDTGARNTRRPWWARHW